MFLDNVEDISRTSDTTNGTTEVQIETNPTFYIPNAWSAIQSGSWAVIVVVVFLWLRYSKGIIEYLDNQKEIQEKLVELHRENSQHQSTMDSRMSKVEVSIERLLGYLLNMTRETSSYRQDNSQRVTRHEEEIESIKRGDNSGR